MFHTFYEMSPERQRARQFTKLGFAFAALAALIFATLIDKAVFGVPLTEDARQVIAWSFVGLAALDALLLVTWSRITAWIISRI